MKTEISFQFNNFDEFFEEQKKEFVEYAEKMTGESFSGKEPLLLIDEIVYMARQLWDEFWSKYSIIS